MKIVFCTCTRLLLQLIVWAILVKDQFATPKRVVNLFKALLALPQRKNIHCNRATLHVPVDNGIETYSDFSYVKVPLGPLLTVPLKSAALHRQFEQDQLA